MRLKQRSRALGSIRVSFDISAGRGCEPLGRIFGPTCRFEGIGVGVPESSRSRARPVLVQATLRQHSERGVELTEVTTRPGHDDQQFGADLRIQLGDVGIIQYP